MENIKFCNLDSVHFYAAINLLKLNSKNYKTALFEHFATLLGHVMGWVIVTKFHINYVLMVLNKMGGGHASKI